MFAPSFHQSFFNFLIAHLITKSRVRKVRLLSSHSITGLLSSSRLTYLKMGPKRIPSSFTSKAVLEGKYIFGASGSKLSATKLPQAESAQSTHLPARPQTTTRTASSASAHPHSKHQQSHHHQKSRAPRNSKARAASSSSNASSTSSAAGGLKKASKAVSNSAARKVQSDNPTVLMCVPKTVAAKVKVIPSKGEGGGKESASKVGGHNSNLRVDSAAPTAMIAPEGVCWW